MRTHTYKTYRFINKDPIIDVLRTAVQEQAKADNIGYRKFLALLHEQSGVTVNTLDAWFKGGTRKPQNATTMAVAIAIGPRGRKALADFILNVNLDNEKKIIPFKKRA